MTLGFVSSALPTPEVKPSEWNSMRPQQQPSAIASAGVLREQAAVRLLHSTGQLGGLKGSRQELRLTTEDAAPSIPMS